MKVERKRLAGLILIGGQSRRMGTDKATLTLAGRPMWKYAADALGPLVSTIMMVGTVEDFIPPSPCRLVPDDPPGLGPLGGLVTGLEQSGCEHHLVVAVDYPLIQRPLLELLLSKADSAKAVCGRSQSFLEPLIGYYHSDCTEAIRAMIAAGDIRTHKLFERVPSLVLAEDEYSQADPERLSQININDRNDIKNLLATRSHLLAGQGE